MHISKYSIGHELLFCRVMSAPPKNQRHLLLCHNCVCWVSYERIEYSVSTAMATASTRREYCYGCWVSQERINVSAVPIAPWVSFQTQLTPCLPWVQQTCRQCEHQGNWCLQQDEEQYSWPFPGACSLGFITFPHWDFFSLDGYQYHPNFFCSSLWKDHWGRACDGY